jgi:uncharacterized protein (DUF362 family)
MIRHWTIILWGAAVLLAAAPASRAQSPAPAAAGLASSRVVLARDPGAVSGLTVNPAKVRGLVSAGIRALTGRADDASAWAAFASSNDVVGIKISTQGGPLQATRPELVDAIIDGLRGAGVPPASIMVWDRDAAKMRAAGYVIHVQSSGVCVADVLPDTGWDPKVFYESKVVGRLIWGDLLFGKADSVLSTQSHLPKLLTQTITKLINVPVLQDNDSCGLAGCLYNVSVQTVDNNRRFESYGQGENAAIVSINAMPAVHGKLVLNIIDGLIGGYAGGPVFSPEYSWAYGGLYFSRDPVANDVMALKVIEEKRREAKISPIGTLAAHVGLAGDVGLGQARPERIELIETGPGRN